MKCVEACLSEALERKGVSMTVEEILEEVEKDRTFYDNSGGGVTLSGGEPLMQYEFASRLAKTLQQKYISVAIETTGYAKYEALYEVVQYCDMILYDIKHMNNEMHRKYVGVENSLILENLKKTAELGKKIIVRIPVIGGVNDDEENIRKTAEYVSSIGLKRIDMLPYHRFGESKYKKINMEYICSAYTPTNEQIDNLKKIVESFGITVLVGG